MCPSPPSPASQYGYNFAMGRILLNLSVCLLSFITVATSTPTITVATGFIPFNYGCSQYQTWYAAYFPSETICQDSPLIALHDGPGFTHEYLDAIKDLASNRTVILYDQFGNGNSTHLDAQTANDTLWSIDLYLSELENVIDYFEFDSFDLLGQGWGGMLGAEYAVSGPEKLRKLVLSSSPGAMYLWVNSQKQLLYDEGFPQDVQDAMAVGFGDPVRYRPALEIYYNSHGCTLDPWPAPLNASFNALFADPTVGIKMYGSLLSPNCAPRGTDNGCCRFVRDPVLSNWTIVDRLKNITVPTLVINGAHDTAQSFAVKPFMDNIPNVTHFTFENSSHTPMWEERVRYMSVVTDFLA